jgi:hypothetical protein
MKPERESHDPANVILWQSVPAAQITARIAIAGDFAPTHNRAISSDDGWREKARRLDPLFQDVNATFVNLECPLAAPLLTDGTYPAAPLDSLEYLSAIRSNTVGLANNHSSDGGPHGLEWTRTAILNRGMVPLGAGGKFGSHPEVRVWRGPGQIRVGFWAATKVLGGPSGGGPAHLEWADLDRGLYALECMRRHEARFCVALLHTGCARSNRPALSDVRLMESLAKWGFDVVAASHSHRLGGASVLDGYRERKSFCFYGLGNLVSNRASSAAETEGLIVVAGFTSQGDLARMEVRPLSLDEQGFGESPAPAASRTILERFRGLSEEIAEGSYGRLFYRDVAREFVKHCIRDPQPAHQGSGNGVAPPKARLLRGGKAHRSVDKLVG